VEQARKLVESDEVLLIFAPLGTAPNAAIQKYMNNMKVPQLFVGLVIGGVGSITGTLAGGLFVLFVPNIAESVSKGLAGAVYGVILLLVIYMMPTGAAGLVRLIVGKLIRRS